MIGDLRLVIQGSRLESGYGSRWGPAHRVQRTIAPLAVAGHSRCAHQACRRAAPQPATAAAEGSTPPCCLGIRQGGSTWRSGSWRRRCHSAEPTVNSCDSVGSSNFTAEWSRWHTRCSRVAGWPQVDMHVIAGASPKFDPECNFNPKPNPIVSPKRVIGLSFQAYFVEAQ